jgi:hypothetical protein
MTLPAPPVPFEPFLDTTGTPRFLHGTKANLAIGALLEAGWNSNFGDRTAAAWVYLTGTLDAATWGAELAQGDGPGRITWSSRPDRSKTTRTSPISGSLETRRGHSARSSRCGSSTSSETGSAIAPNSSGR